MRHSFSTLPRATVLALGLFLTGLLVGPAAAQTAFGYYLAGGVDVAPDHQVLLRFDHYDPDRPNSPAPENQMSLGYNFDPTPMLRVLVNYQTSVADLMPRQS